MIRGGSGCTARRGSNSDISCSAGAIPRLPTGAPSAQGSLGRLALRSSGVHSSRGRFILIPAGNQNGAPGKRTPHISCSAGAIPRLPTGAPSAQGSLARLALRPSQVLSLRGAHGAPGRDRTCDPKFRKLVLYPTELRARRSKTSKNTLLGQPWCDVWGNEALQPIQMH